MKSSVDAAPMTLAATHDGRRKKRLDYRRLLFQIVFLLPAVGFLVVFMFYPIEETFRTSMMQTSALSPPTFIGFENYQRLFASAEFRKGLANVLAWAFWSVVIQIPLAFFIAFSLVAYSNRLTSKLRVIYYMASIMPSAIVAMLGRFIFAPRFGVISTIAQRFGWAWLQNVDFLGDPNKVFWSLFAIATWAYIGFGIVYLMANIEQIPMEIREAAELDGANRLQYALYVVLPMVSYPIRILAIISTVGSLKLFDVPYLMTGGGPVYYSTTLAIILYKQGFVNWRYGRAAAVGVIIFLLSLAFSIAQFSMQRKGGELD
ncbi:MAG: sugar ABC transporter permease [Bacillota bacterium]|jgi:raffinose/stachyose/melibiose transport system permease protein|nr:sugar ABC transporter permease [Bacillota bacterium]